MVPTLAKSWCWTMVCTPSEPWSWLLKIPALAPGYRKEHRSGWRRGFQDHGSEGVQTMVPDHGFTRVGTMQVQAIMPPLNQWWGNYGGGGGYHWRSCQEPVPEGPGIREQCGRNLQGGIKNLLMGHFLRNGSFPSDFRGEKTAHQGVFLRNGCFPSVS